MTDLRLNFLSLEVLQGVYLQTRESNSNLQDRITQLCGGKWSCWKASSSKESQPPRDWWCWLPPVKSAAWSNCTTAYTSSKGKNASFEPCADNTALRANKACSTKGWKCWKLNFHQRIVFHLKQGHSPEWRWKILNAGTLHVFANLVFIGESVWYTEC